MSTAIEKRRGKYQKQEEDPLIIRAKYLKTWNEMLSKYRTTRIIGSLNNKQRKSKKPPKTPKEDYRKIIKEY